MEELISKMEKLAMVKEELQALKDSFENDNRYLIDGIAKLEEEIKTEALKYKRSIVSPNVELVYNDGRVTWDSRFLSGYAINHPEILDAKKVGKPFVSIKMKGRK